MKFLSNSPVTHVAANTHPAVPVPAVVTITCNYNFAVNKWNQLNCMCCLCYLVLANENSFDSKT